MISMWRIIIVIIIDVIAVLYIARKLRDNSPAPYVDHARREQMFMELPEAIDMIQRAIVKHYVFDKRDGVSLVNQPHSLFPMVNWAAHEEEMRPYVENGWQRGEHARDERGRFASLDEQRRWQSPESGVDER